MYSYENLYKIAADFRKAIELAQKAGEFARDVMFRDYPYACCGDASVLLGHHLLNMGIKTYYACGHYRQGDFTNYQSHAWLITINGITIDITGDQFRYKSQFYNYNIPVYVGDNDEFHELFEIEPRDVRISVPLERINGLNNNRLPKLYQTIIQYLGSYDNYKTDT